MAVTDPLQIIASPLGYQATDALMQFLKDYFEKEAVEKVVLGLPLKSDGSDTDATPLVRQFQSKFVQAFPTIPVILHDEGYSSQQAVQAMVSGGMKKSKRREKGQVDTIAATLILQSYMQSR